MTLKINKKYILLVLLFLTALNFFNLQLYLFVLCFFILLVQYIKNDKHLTINREIILLFLFSITYTVIVFCFENIGYLTSTMYLFFPVFAYFIGYHFTQNINDLKKMFYSISVGFMLHGFLNLLVTSNFSIYSRVVLDFWSNIEMSATLQGIYFVFFLSLFFIAIFEKIKTLNRIIIFVGVIGGVYCSLITSSRTPIVIFVVVFIINLLLFVLNNLLKLKTMTKFFLNFLFVLLLFGNIYSNNFFDIRDSFVKSNLSKRIESISENKVEDARSEAQKYIINHMFDEPFGGSNLQLPQGLVYAHNLWLDIIYRTGIVPFFLFFIYTTLSIKNIINLYKLKNIDFIFKLTCVSIIVGTYLNFTVEPIIEGAFFYLLYIIVFNGAIKKILVMSKNDSNVIGKVS